MKPCCPQGKPNRMVAGFAEIAERKEVLVAGACNHPNCLVLSFRFPSVPMRAQVEVRGVLQQKVDQLFLVS